MTTDTVTSRPRRQRAGRRPAGAALPKLAADRRSLVVVVAFLYVLPTRRSTSTSASRSGDGTCRSTPPAPTWPRCCSLRSIYVLLALGLNVVVGYAGLLDLGYFGFFAVGAYTVALLTSPDSKLITEYDWLDPWPWLVTVPIAIALTMLSGVMLGWPTLRLRGDYLAIVTLGFAEIIRIVATAPGLDPQRRPGHPEHPAPAGHVRRTASRSSACSTPGRTTGWCSRVIILVVFVIAEPGAQPGRPGLDRDPGGRGRGRADGRADVQVQAVGVRDRRGDRRPVRRAVRRQAELHQLGRPSSLVNSILVLAGGASSAARATSRRDPRRLPGRRTCRSGCAASSSCSEHRRRTSTGSLVFGLGRSIVMMIFRPQGI